LFYSKSEVLQIIEKSKEIEKAREEKAKKDNNKPTTPRGESPSNAKAISNPKLGANVTQHHSFKDKTLTSPTFCEICTKFIWGIYPVAHHCTSAFDSLTLVLFDWYLTVSIVCKAFVHKKCFQEEFLTSPCPFPNSRAASQRSYYDSYQYPLLELNFSLVISLPLSGYELEGVLVG